MSLKDFWGICSLKNLIKEPICFKNPTNPKCSDLMITNRLRSFQNCVIVIVTCVIETGLSDFRKMAVTVLRYFSLNVEHKVIFYRDYQNFTIDNYRSFIEELSGNLQITNKTALDPFLDICREALNKTVPLKQKFVRASNSPFMNKTKLRAIMKRTRYEE